MNIFILDESPVLAAQQQCNRHVVKMVTESAQMLSTAHRILDGTPYKGPSKSGKRMVKKWFHPEHNDLLYGAVHMNHPCTVWTMKTSANYMWHYEHFVALSNEYTHRYGKTHGSYLKLNEVLSTPPKNIPHGQLTQFPLAMKSNPECMFPEDPVKSYKAFYQTKQHRFKMLWTNRDKPEWFQREVQI